MAASSSSSSSSSSRNPQGKKYEVFISFRGPDVRYKFLSHLLLALDNKQIKAFMDDTDLQRGKPIAPTLLKTIEESYISIVIFSKDYPNSEWCLEELQKILECLQSKHQIVVPVFYHVDPSAVQDLQENYTLTTHAGNFTDRQLVKWRNALREISNLSGFNSAVYTSEARLCYEIANDASRLLTALSPAYSLNYGLFDIDSRIEDVESLIEKQVNGVSTVGIWGMGGIGKTTLADKVFNGIKGKFCSHCFVSNVKGKLSKNSAIEDLRDEIIRELLGEKEKTKIGTPYTIDDSIRRRLDHKKVLIVLDDVDDCMQLKSLLEDSGLYSPGMFYPGSRFIVTSRDKQVLRNVPMEKHLYEVKQLKNDQALQLFSWRVFGQSSPGEGYKELSENVVKYAQGLPLALVVLASELKGKKVEEWEDALRKYSSIPRINIQNILRVSFDRLDRDEKSIFLDIACFYRGFPREYVETVLECFDFYSKIGIGRLFDKSLISIEEKRGTEIIEMHDLIQQMGQEIVVEESKGMLEKQSRLLKDEEIGYILATDRVADVEVLSLNVGKIGRHINISCKAFINMRKLRFLEVSGFPYDDKNNICLAEGLKFLPNSLRYLCWSDFPLRTFPSNLLESLVELNMMRSNIEEFVWEKPLKNLRRVYLHLSESLIKISDLAKAPKLEVLELPGCRSLVEIGSSMEKLNNLTKLDPRWSTSLPDSVRNLKRLNISFCQKLNKLPEDLVNSQNLEELSAVESGLQELPSCTCNLRSLRNLDISGCKNLKKLPKNLGNLKSLKKLDALGSSLEELPSSICNMRYLERLDISFCRNLNNLPEDLGNLESLEELNTCGSDLKELPFSIKGLCNLRRLVLTGCKKLESLPDLPQNLEELHAGNCRSLQSVSATFKFPHFLLDLHNCDKLNERASSIIQQRLWELQYLSAAKCPRLLIPGSEIPKWMKYRNDGNSALSLELNTHGRSSIHVIFCAIISFGYHSWDCWGVKVTALLTDEQGGKTNYIFSRYGDFIVKKYSANKHMCLWDGLVERNVREASFSTLWDDMKVESIGVHPLLEIEDDKDQDSAISLSLFNDRKRKR